MTHGTTDALSTWCGRDVQVVHGWAKDEGDVECIDCLREEMDRLRFQLQQSDRQLQKLRGQIGSKTEVL